MSMQASVSEAATLNAVAEFGYFWFAGLIEEDPYPVVRLDRAEIVDRDHLDDLVIVEDAVDRATDAAETIDTNFHYAASRCRSIAW